MNSSVDELQRAPITVHAAAGLGLLDRLTRMPDTDPSLVHAKGGDGCTPLHFSRAAAMAKMLLDGGADIDARDEDHDSTPAQWLIGEVPEAARLLLSMARRPTSLSPRRWGIARWRRNLSRPIRSAPDTASGSFPSSRPWVIRNAAARFISGRCPSTLIRTRLR
jgi:hypothetical protein